MLKLYSYFRSSAAYRVRIALNLKGLSYEILPVHLTKAGGEQRRPEYRSVNPQMRVPTLAVSTNEVLTQSLAIIEYLDETHPEPPLLPRNPVLRAKIRAVAQAIACDIHPLNNLVVLQYLKRTLNQEQATIDSLVCALDRRRVRGDRGDDCSGSLCVRRRGQPRRRLPRAAGGQRAALQALARTIPAHRRGRNGLP